MDSIFKESNLLLKDIHLIAVNAGPGSYTGLRVGITGVNSLSWANQIPSIGVSNLYNMAYSSAHQGRIVALMYGNEKDAFMACYQNYNGYLTPLKIDEKVTWEEAQQACEQCDQILYFAPKKQDIPFQQKVTEWQPTAKYIGCAALNLFAKQENKCYGTIAPNYLRDFEVTRKQTTIIS